MAVYKGSTIIAGASDISDRTLVIDILKEIYPVGSVYIGTQNICPMASLFGTWELVAQDRALWGGNSTNGGTLIEAGLPNITAGLSGVATNGAGVSGAATVSGGSDLSYTGGGSAAYWLSKNTYTIDASKQNPIYGKSSTVQPAAYVVNVWRRTA